MVSEISALNISKMRVPSPSPKPTANKLKIPDNDLTGVFDMYELPDDCFMEITHIRRPKRRLNSYLSDSSDGELYIYDLNCVSNYTRKHKEVCEEAEPMDIPDKFSLARDAANYQEMSPGSDHKTFLCVALRYRDGALRKFVFYNMDSPMTPEVRQAAIRKNYCCIKAPQCHAEMQFYTFLIKRNFNSLRYTHILAMGCSRKHCSECDLMLRVGMGRGYYSVTSAAQSLGTSVTSTDLMNGNQFSICTTKKYELHRERDAVAFQKKYSNFYLTTALQKIIEESLMVEATFGGRYVKTKTKSVLLY